MQVVNKEEVKDKIHKAYFTSTTFDIELNSVSIKELFDCVDTLLLFPTNMCQIIINYVNVITFARITRPVVCVTNAKTTDKKYFYATITDDRVPITPDQSAENERCIQLCINDTKLESIGIVNGKYIIRITYSCYKYKYDNYPYQLNLHYSDEIIESVMCIITLFGSIFL